MRSVTKSSARGHYGCFDCGGSGCGDPVCAVLGAAGPTASDSYTFGYNNRAGVLLLLIFAASVAVWKRGLPSRAPLAAESKATRVLAAALAIEAAACGAVVLLVGLGGRDESNLRAGPAEPAGGGARPYTGLNGRSVRRCSTGR